mmetsp:Transcript_22853/g.22694  ORF Transcript_22853/g.22694 Transcript_22853/m.22694 type:complete len:124 (-) Transcript_22853:49-420(-)
MWVKNFSSDTVSQATATATGFEQRLNSVKMRLMINFISDKKLSFKFAREEGNLKFLKDLDKHINKFTQNSFKDFCRTSPEFKCVIKILIEGETCKSMFQDKEKVKTEVPKFQWALERLKDLIG